MNRRRILGGLLIITVALTLWTQWSPREADPTVSPATPAAPIRLADRRPASAPAPAAGIEIALKLPQRRVTASPRGVTPGALFGEPARPTVAPVEATAPPPPSAPPLPFTFGGRLVVDGDVAYLLSDAARTLILRPGAAAGEFLLESADERQLLFRHQPTGLPVALSIGG